MKFPGIVLEEPIAEKIWYGEVKKISIPKSIKLENNPLYYMDKSNCFGIFKVQLLGELEDKNIYQILILDKFETPKPVETSDKILVEDVKFMGVTTTTDVRGSPIENKYGLQPIKIKKKKRTELDVKELSVVKRGNRWCVVHGHPDTGGSRDKPIGSVIKCFPSKAKADAMHQAIIISQKKRKLNLDGVELMKPYIMQKPCSQTIYNLNEL